MLPHTSEPNSCRSEMKANYLAPPEQVEQNHVAGGEQDRHSETVAADQTVLGKRHPNGAYSTSSLNFPSDPSGRFPSNGPSINFIQQQQDRSCEHSFDESAVRLQKMLEKELVYHESCTIDHLGSVLSHQASNRFQTMIRNSCAACIAQAVTMLDLKKARAEWHKQGMLTEQKEKMIMKKIFSQISQYLQDGGSLLWRVSLISKCRSKLNGSFGCSLVICFLSAHKQRILDVERMEPESLDTLEVELMMQQDSSPTENPQSRRPNPSYAPSNRDRSAIWTNSTLVNGPPSTVQSAPLNGPIPPNGSTPSIGSAPIAAPASSIGSGSSRLNEGGLKGSIGRQIGVGLLTGAANQLIASSTGRNEPEDYFQELLGHFLSTFAKILPRSWD